MDKPAWPYLNHRDMADVMTDERSGCRCELSDDKGHRLGCPIYAAIQEFMEGDG